MIIEDMSVTRARLRDIIMRRERGLPIADDEIDVLLRVEAAFVALDDATRLPTSSVARRSSESLPEMVGRLEDASHDAQSAAADLKHALERLRNGLSRAA